MNLSKLKDIQLVLENPNGKPLGIIQARDIKYSPRFNGIGELSFLVDKDNCDFYDLITSGRTVLMENFGRFVIDSPEDEDEGISNTKTVNCKSFEFDINRKTIPYLEGTYKFYSVNQNDETIMSIIMSYLPNWTLESVDSNLLNIYRTFDFYDRPLYQSMQEDFSSAYECIFIYDTINCKIKVVSYENVIKNSDIYLSFDNLVNKIELTEKSEEILTALSVYGGNDLSINIVNIFGDTMYDFSYFTDTIIDNRKFMSDSLILSIKAWEASVNTYQSDYADLLLQRKNKLKDKVDLEVELTEYRGELPGLISVRDALLESGQNASSANANITSKQNQINSCVSGVNSILNDLDVIENNISYIQNQVSFENNFTIEELKELDKFIYHQSVTDEYFVVNDIDTDDVIQETAQELYNKYKKLLARNKDLKYDFEIELENFIPYDDYKVFTSQLDFATQITLKHSNGKLSYPILLGLDIDLENDSIKFLFSTEMRLRNQTDEYNEYLANTLGGAANKVTNNSLQWGKYVNSGAKGKLEDFLANGLNLDNQEIKSATGQQLVIDSTGMLGRKEVSEGVFSPEQWKFINNKLMFTDDFWNTAKLGLGLITLPDGTKMYGLNADAILGKLGIFAQVQAQQIVVGDFGEKISNDVLDIDLDLDDVVKLNELYNHIIISQENGIQVLDRLLRERIRLGNYKTDKYGLVVKDKRGSTTVLDEDGLLQTWQEGRTDNVDSTNPLNLYLYLPEQTNTINKAILRFKREKFRAYSKSIEAGGGVVSTATSSDLVAAVVGLATDVDEQTVNTGWAGDPSHVHSFIKTIHHKHAIDISPHTHSLTLPDHTHDIEYGIYESTTPNNIKISINGTDYTTYLGGKNGYFNEDKDNIDITTLIKRGIWNVITISSGRLGRIEATVFIQAFINTTRHSIVLGDEFVDNTLMSITSQLKEVDITIRRTDIIKPPDKLFRITNILDTAYVYSSDWNNYVQQWYQEFEIPDVKSVSIAMDGHWEYDDVDSTYELITSEYPFIFWVNANNELYVQTWNKTVTKLNLANGVTKVKSLRAWKNVVYPEKDQGVVCAYIKTDGKVYYRNYCYQELTSKYAWEEERQIEEFMGNAVNLNMFNTNDYRMGISIEDSSGNVQWLLTDRNWAGMAIAPINFSVAPMNVSATLLPIEYPEFYDIEQLSLAPMEITSELLFALTDNIIMLVKNIPNEDDDWGWIIEVNVKYPIDELLLNKITVTDIDKSTNIAISSINKVNDYKFNFNVDNIIEDGINNVTGDIKVKIDGIYNEAGYLYDTMIKDFTPTNLVPTVVNIPEVEEMWNE